MVRTILIVLALITPFVMPWQFALIVGVAASYFVPPLALVLGVLFEVLYGAGGFPTALVAGIIICALMFGVRHFVKARIMSV